MIAASLLSRIVNNYSYLKDAFILRLFSTTSSLFEPAVPTRQP